MGALTAEWMDTAIIFFAVALFLIFYYTSRMSRFHKKKWLIVVSSFILLSSLIAITQAYRTYAQGRPPTHAKLQNAMAANRSIHGSAEVKMTP